MNKKEIELRKNTLENKLKDTFITDFHLENLTEEEQNIFLQIMVESYSYAERYHEGFGYMDELTCLLQSGLNMQNFHILKSIKENNDKLDTLIEQNKSLIELLSKDK